MRRTFCISPLLLLSLLAACCASGGCSASDKDDRDRERVGQVGVNVPLDADRVERGRNEISYRAQDDGVVYLYDRDARRLVTRHNVRRDEVFAVNPSRDRVTIDGRSVYERNLERDHEHEIYFLSNRDFDRAVDRDPDLRKIPRGAELVKEGKGDLSYRAERDGTVYLSVADDGRLVMRREIRRGQLFEVSPRRDQVTLDRRDVFEHKLDRDHAHRIYFLSEEQRERNRDR